MRTSQTLSSKSIQKSQSGFWNPKLIRPHIRTLPAYSVKCNGHIYDQKAWSFFDNSTKSQRPIRNIIARITQLLMLQNGRKDRRCIKIKIVGLWHIWGAQVSFILFFYSIAFPLWSIGIPSLSFGFCTLFSFYSNLNYPMQTLAVHLTQHRTNFSGWNHNVLIFKSVTNWKQIHVRNSRNGCENMSRNGHFLLGLIFL